MIKNQHQPEDNYIPTSKNVVGRQLDALEYQDPEEDLHSTNLSLEKENLQNVRLWDREAFIQGVQQEITSN